MALEGTPLRAQMHGDGCGVGLPTAAAVELLCRSWRDSSGVKLEPRREGARMPRGLSKGSHGRAAF